MSRIVVAGTHSGVGKTSVALGLIGALRHRGLRVAPFKVGPDFIDPAFHARAAEHSSRSLDGWFLPVGELCRALTVGSEGADLALIEGMMGLHDGRSATSEEGSTAAVAKALRAPVLLVVDVSAQARSAAATVLGFRRFDPDVEIVGVIANGVASPGHLALVREAVAAATGLPILGSLPRDERVTLPERHLGLVLPDEVAGLDAALERLAELVSERFDLDEIVRLASMAPALERPPARSRPRGGPVRIAVARDEAFGFYYPENLELLEEMGAEVVPFSPLRDASLPSGTAGVYLGGGYPELHAAALAANRAMLDALRRAAVPIYAECGGMMYLTRGLWAAGACHEWVGLLPTWTTMTSPRPRIAYVAGTLARDCPLGPRGEPFKGHVFHRSSLDPELPSESAAFTIAEPRPTLEGYAADNLIASYVHLHFGAVPELAENWLKACLMAAGGRV